MPELPKSADANVAKLAEVLNDVLAKLDADSGVNDTDFESLHGIDDVEGNAI